MERQDIQSSLKYELDQMIIFTVGKEEYGVYIQKVKEVIRIREITKIPNVPSFVKGVINLRGDVIPIIDLREKFGLEHEEYTDMTHVIVVEVEGKSIGMVVDNVSHVIRISKNQIVPAPLMVGGISQDYIEGVGKLDENLIVILNIERILTTDEKIELEEIEEIKREIEAN